VFVGARERLGKLKQGRGVRQINGSFWQCVCGARPCLSAMTRP
jgi:hypothetical protein